MASQPAAVLLARLRSAPAGTTSAALTRALRDADPARHGTAAGR